MRFSIITVCYGAGEQLAGTIDSVRAQTHPEIEHIVVDGASPDATTRAVLDRYRDGRAKIISEPDQGVYDAMNKGLSMATGEVIGLLNAGDLLAAPDVISKLHAEFLKGDADVIYGDAFMVDPGQIDKVRRYWRGGLYDRDKFRRGWMPPHLGTYIRKGIYDRLGRFDLRFHIAADYELLFRFLYKHNVRARYVPLPIVRFRLGGKSNRSLRHIWQANLEVYRAWGVNGFRISPFIMLRKPLRKIAQMATHH